MLKSHWSASDVLWLWACHRWFGWSLHISSECIWTEFSSSFSSRSQTWENRIGGFAAKISISCIVFFSISVLEFSFFLWNRAFLVRWRVFVSLTGMPFISTLIFSILLFFRHFPFKRNRYTAFMVLLFPLDCDPLVCTIGSFDSQFMLFFLVVIFFVCQHNDVVSPIVKTWMWRL